MDYIGATPQQNPIMGLLAERLKQAQQFAAKPFGYSNPPAEMLMNLLGIPAVQQTAERLAYGEPLTTGRGMTTRPRPEAVEAALTVAPVAGLLGKAAEKGMMAAGRAGERYAERVVPQIMERGGLPAQLLQDLAQGSRSNAIELGSEFLGKKPPKIENLARTSDKFLFHSSTADKAKDLKYGIEPQAGGDWVREIAAGATDQNLDDFFENVVPLAWFSDNPDWIKAMVGRKLNKPFDKVTAKDIEEHGHLAFINKKSPEAENITYIPEQGLMKGSQSVVYDINKANPRKAWETGLYQESRYGSQMEPFGVEKNEYVSPESVEPLIQLTGPELVRFMRLKGLLE